MHATSASIAARSMNVSPATDSSLPAKALGNVLLIAALFCAGVAAFVF